LNFESQQSHSSRPSRFSTPELPHHRQVTKHPLMPLARFESITSSFCLRRTHRAHHRTPSFGRGSEEPFLPPGSASGFRRNLQQTQALGLTPKDQLKARDNSHSKPKLQDVHCHKFASKLTRKPSLTADSTADFRRRLPPIQRRAWNFRISNHPPTEHRQAPKNSSTFLPRTHGTISPSTNGSPMGFFSPTPSLR
jgi:hypothetical protein